MLGYDSDFGDLYDNEIASLVLRFQTDNGHTSRDGAVGPGTRRLLIRKLIEDYGDSVFGRMIDPQPGYIFVSYKREDLPRIASVLDRMESWGHRCWMDKAIPGGAQYHAHLAEKVAGCRFLLVFLSQEAADSKWVQREVQFADSKNKHVLPVLLEPVELGGGLEIILSQYQMVDATRSDFANELKWAIESMS